MLLTLLPLVPVQQAADPYIVITRAVKAAHDAGQFVFDVSGFSQSGSASAVSSQLRIYVKGDKFLADGFIDNARAQQLVCDGVKVWRYDPVKNEYSWSSKPDDLTKTFAIGAAWARTEFQRPLRLLALSSRWLTIPKITFLPDETSPTSIRLSQVKQLQGGDWRGTDITYQLETPNGRISSVTIAERLDMPSGTVKASHYVGTFLYPPSLSINFAFTPPRGAKPSADLPSRVSGG